MSFWWLILFCSGAYIVGNVNFAILISKYRFRADIRKNTSGTPGAANILRAHGVRWGMICLLCDAAKGSVAALVGFLSYGFSSGWGTDTSFLIWSQAPDAAYIALFACGLSAAVGHCYPVFYKFRGGKGVSTALGVFFVANPPLAIAAFAVALVFGQCVMYSSVGSFTLITTLALVQGFAAQAVSSTVAIFTVAALIAAIYFFILFVHRANVARLLFGKENRTTLLAKIVKKRNRKKQHMWLDELI